MNDMILNALICVIGLLLHFSMKWYEARKSVAGLGAVDYVKSVPAQSMISLLSTAGAFAVMYALEWLNPGAAFACGYMGNSVAENLAGKFSNPNG